MSRIAIPIGLGLLLGWAALHASFLGWWALIPWGAGALGLGYWLGKPRFMFAGGLYGITLASVFIFAGYTGAAPVVTPAPLFPLLAFFSAICGSGLAMLGAYLKPRTRDAA